MNTHSTAHSTPTDCDILIIGAGPAGMAAAQAAAPSGRRIVVVDDNFAVGGQIWRDGPNATLPAIAQTYRRVLAQHHNITLLNSTRVVAVNEHRQILLENSEYAWWQNYDRIILCTGSRELLLPFPGWTLPGVTGVGGLQALIKSGVPVDGQRIVIAGSGPLLLAAAATARKAGAKVIRIAEQATAQRLWQFGYSLWRWPSKAIQSVRLGISNITQYRGNSHILNAMGQNQVESVQLKIGSKIEQFDCDRLACGFGLVPNTQLGEVLGCLLKPTSGLSVNRIQETSVPNCFAAGECTGIGGSERALVQGAIAGYAAVGNLNAVQALENKRHRWQDFADCLHKHFTLSDALKTLAQDDTLVCRCEDVPLAALQTCGSWIDAKIHTRCGMGSCQGRVCGAATQFIFDWNAPSARQIISPVRLDSFMGCCLMPHDDNTARPVVDSH